VISFGVSIASIFGDLFESYLKRKANVKDSGNILPGHGGVLDRIDGYLFGAPLMWAIIQAMGA
jgi:phosphatidate cytidylyltransferase